MEDFSNIQSNFTTFRLKLEECYYSADKYYGVLNNPERSEMKSVINWILSEDRQIPDALGFVGIICREKNQARAPLSRLRIIFTTD